MFLSIIAQENIFYDIPERKNAFLGYKNKKFQKTKNWHFSKRVNHSFAPKMAIFPLFLERKNAFLGYENNKF